MMQSAEVGLGDDLAGFRQLNNSRLGRVAVERQGRACLMVVGEVVRQDATKMSLVEDDHVVQALAANRADQAFALVQFRASPALPERPIVRRIVS